ncbi:hypothetical protein COL5a_006315 [Colletotrichum fioriniae]|nr:uncharacterized protein COL516b_005259 [Colletotrichum fioriniae]KAJ0305563.1 hypothetical protein COL516b_005259 [Colletotrichum fioriniae]KAJ0327138.1 hypothetical protein COL5a_006315 [Colletotrichum fioriniae]
MMPTLPLVGPAVNSSKPFGQQSPPQASCHGFTPGRRSYAPDASIVLVGIRGTGRSTLAVIAASALGFRLLDADQQFFQMTGLSRASYKTQHGTAEYRREELKLLHSMLFENPTKSVIACGPGAVEETGQAWLAEYGQTHPIIYVLRDAEDVKMHLKVWDTDAITRLFQLSGPTHRSISNFEFYNISDTLGKASGEVTTIPGHQSPRSLALKRVEYDFLGLIDSIMESDRQGSERYRATEGSASLPLERRPYTYSLNLPMSLVETAGAELRNITTTADVAELVIPVRELQATSAEFDDATANRVCRLLYAVRRFTRLPIVLNLELESSSTGIMSCFSPEHASAYYLNVLNHGLRLAPEYLCVDLRCDENVIRDLVASKGTTKIIAHYTCNSLSPSGWRNPGLEDKMRLAEDLGCDVVRICREAKSTKDNFEIQHFKHGAGKPRDVTIPLIAYNTGRLGRMSCFMNPTFTPVTMNLLRRLAPGGSPHCLLTIHEAQKALYSSFLLDPMYFGIYGTNASTSLSPCMHNPAFKFCGMPHEYKIFHQPTLNHLRKLISDENFGGASITAPFKKEVFAIVDFTSPEARAIGAVNTLVPLRSRNIESLLDRNRAGPVVALYGDNTDWIGIHTCIRHNLSPINGVKRRTTALVVGAGGMARAAIYGLLRLGVRTVLIHNRTTRTAEEVVRHFNGYRFTSDGASTPTEVNASEKVDTAPNSPTIRVIESKDDKWPDDADFPTIVVSCISTREINGESSADTSLPAGWLASPTGGVAIELSYTPLETPLLKQIRGMSDQGWIAVDGLSVLPEQGKRQFELFTARKPPIEMMRELISRAYKERLAEGGKMPTRG